MGVDCTDPRNRLSHGPMSPGSQNLKQEVQQKHSALDARLQKTKLCRYNMHGGCKHGSKCPFAHGVKELSNRPDFSKTRMCPDLQEKGACIRNNCSFAHSSEELRTADFCYKTTMCIWYAAGKCRNGANCCFAHGADECKAVNPNLAKAPKAEKSSRVNGDVQYGWQSKKHDMMFATTPTTDPMFIPLGAAGLYQEFAPPPHPYVMGVPNQFSTMGGYPGFNENMAIAPVVANTLSEHSLQAHQVNTLSAHIKSLSKQVKKLQESITPSTSSTHGTRSTRSGLSRQSTSRQAQANQYPSPSGSYGNDSSTSES